jgi:hypothetical protein
MKNIVFLALAIIFFSCSNNTEKGAWSEEDIAGIWKLEKVIKTETNEEVKLTDCDLQTEWNFTNEEAEALGDGTEVKKIVATAPDDCKWYGFDSKWTVKDENLFISSTRIGGIGGLSFAGLFKIVEITEAKMVVEILKHQYTFVK